MSESVKRFEKTTETCLHRSMGRFEEARRRWC